MPFSHLNSGSLEIIVSPSFSSYLTAKLKVALASGSSTHGNACLAKVVSN